MADINVERKGGGRSIWPWILGLLLLGALLFGLSRCSNDEEEVPVAAATPDSVAPSTAADTTGMGAVAAPMPMTDTAGGAAAGNDTIPVAQLVNTATAGQQVSGLARVTEVVSDRGFWISQGGQRMFAVVGENQGQEQAVDINQGQVLRMSGQVMAGGADVQVPGQIEAETRRIATEQKFFVMVEPRNVQVVSGG